MGFEQTPLLGGEDLQLSAEHKRSITSSIITKWALSKFIFPTLLVIYILLGAAFVVLGVFAHGWVFYLLAISFFLSALRHMARITPYSDLSSKYQEEARELFTSRYIGSWVFERSTWAAFNKYRSQQRTAQAWRIVLISLAVMVICGAILYGIFLIVFGTTSGRLTKEDILLSAVVVWFPIAVCFAAILLFQGLSLLYYHFRGFNPKVHSCVLARGSLYQMNSFMSLQPAIALRDKGIFNLISVRLERKMIYGISLNILCVNVAVKNGGLLGTPPCIEVPVPDVMLQSVTSWAQQFVEGYTSDIIVDLEQPVYTKEPVPTLVQHVQAPQTSTIE